MPASIFAGSKVKTLKSTLSLNGGADIISSITNPQSSAVSAEPGSLLLNTTSGIMYRKLDAGLTTNWVEVGSGAGTKNYIKNPDFDGGLTTGWSMQKVSLSSLVPTGNIGAADAGHTISASSSSPLEGANSLLVQGASLFTAGNCLVSDAFAIDRQDQAKVMGWSFYFEAITSNMDFSGTSAGTWAVYIAEVTTATPDTVVSWIQPAGVYNLIQSSGAGIASGTFQTTAAGTAYRLVLVCINSEAAATTLKVDDFQLGPQSTVQGAAISDWVSYTPTIAGSPTPSGTSALNAGKWRRVGDSIELNLYLHMGSTGTAGSATNAIWGLPGGLAVDLTKLARGNSQTVGHAMFWNTVSESNLVIQAASTGVFVETTTGNPVQANTILANYQIAIVAFLPIQGWSSNTVLSQDTDTRVVQFNGSESLTTALSGSPTTINFTSINDSHGAYSSGSYTVPVSGRYSLAASVPVFCNSVGTTATGYFYKTGVLTTIGSNQTITSLSTGNISVSGSESFNAGDIITFRVSNSGGTAQLSGQVGSISISRLSGPATIAASETVAASYSHTAGQQVNTEAYINFSQKNFDTHNMYTAGSGYNPANPLATSWTVQPKVTIPVSGKYLISCTLATSFEAYTQSEFIGTNIYKNGGIVGTAVNRPDATIAAGSHNWQMTAIQMVQCAAGDIIQFTFKQNSGGARNLLANADFNHFEITRVGN